MDKLVNKTLAQALGDLYGRINYERQIKVSRSGFRLQTMRELLRRLGDPQLQYRVVHVAGTKGKGSVSTMIGQISTDSGLRTGVYTSPHLETINQRMAIDGVWITDDQLLEILLEVDQVVRAMDEETDPATEPFLTFFEITTAATMLFFARQKVDLAVLEVGLGGRMDSTNVCQPDVCVITNISFDHTKQLGSTLEKIATEKAGIIKQGIPVVSGTTEPTASAAIAKIAAEHNATVYQLDREIHLNDGRDAGSQGKPAGFSMLAKLGDQTVDLSDLSVGLPGAHQRKNAVLAISAVSLLSSYFEIGEGAIRSGLNSVRLNGRTEIMSRCPLVVLDIAHNPASAAALAETLVNELPAWQAAKRRILVFATSRDKNASKMLEPLIEIAGLNEIYLTKYQSNPRAASIERTLEATQETLSAANLVVHQSETPSLAWAEMLSDINPEDSICIAGSAFLVAELRPLIRQWAAANQS